MSFELLVGPPGSGKTRTLLERGRSLVAAGERVWWAGLPSQRAGFYRLATTRGALLGLEFQTLQQIYYRLLAHAQELKPLVVGTGRLAMVGEALARERGLPPAPGEARLFAAAIAEAKRYGMAARDIPGDDPELERLRVVYRSYERLKGEQWDYDDFRSRALALALEGRARLEADALIVDGLREIGPLDLRLLQALGAAHHVWLSLPEAPPACAPHECLAPRDSTRTAVYRAPNPIAEVRWVLRALKRDLAAGIDPLDLAVVLPRGESGVFAALADEYGVPVMDESATALADSLPGRLLLELLELPDHPTASRLLPIRELSKLADAALDAGVGGHVALSLLAERLGLAGVWREWLRRLEVPEDSDSWAASLVDHALELADGESGTGLPAGLFRRQALQRAKEASRVASGEGFRAWWAALLKESGVILPRRGGVALLDERLASGRRFRRAYIVSAVVGAYGAGEAEDYFVPEDGRVSAVDLFAAGSGLLPRRFAGRDRLLFAELRSLADDLVITYPEASQSGPLLPEPRLTGGDDAPLLPELPAGSRLELAETRPFRARVENVELYGDPDGELDLEELRLYDECGMRYWLDRLLPSGGTARHPFPPSAGDGPDALAADLRAGGRLGDADLANLVRRYPEAAPWLESNARRLRELTFGVRLRVGDNGVHARLDGAAREGREARLYRIVPSGGATGVEDARRVLNDRWTELWAAGYMLERHRRSVERVRIYVWPVPGEPIDVYGRAIDYLWSNVKSRRDEVRTAYERYRAGDITPSPGFRCKGCRVRDVCREGAR